MEEFKSNSHKSRETRETRPIPEKRIDKVTTGAVKTRKKSEVKKLADIFLPEDIESVKSYIFMDVLIPSLKKAISDIVTNGIDMILYGESGHRDRSTSSKISYNSIYNRSNGNSSSSSSARKYTPGYNYDDIVLETRGEAENVLSRMDEIIETYGVLSVADMYDLVGMTCNYTDNKYGWTDIRNASVVRIRDGYVIKMPKAMPIDRN